MQISALQKKINQKDFSPFYVFYGTEHFLIEEMKQAVIDGALDEETTDFNLAVMDMEETPVEAVVDEANTLPFMGERRVIVVKNPFFFTGAVQKNKIEHDLKKLQSYINDPSPQSVIIFTAPYQKLDSRKKLVKSLKQTGEVHGFSELDESAVFELLNDRAKAHEVSLTKEGNGRLLQLIGPKMMRLVAEIEKMALYVGDGGEITREVVDLLAARSLESDVFALVDHVARHRVQDGFRILHDLLKQNEEPIKLLALLARQFRIMYLVKELGERGYSQNQMARQLKLHPYPVKIAAAQAKSITKDDLLTILDECAEADYEMKTGKKDKNLVLELLLTKMAG